VVVCRSGAPHVYFPSSYESLQIYITLYNKAIFKVQNRKKKLDNINEIFTSKQILFLFSTSSSAAWKSFNIAIYLKKKNFYHKIAKLDIYT